MFYTQHRLQFPVQASYASVDLIADMYANVAAASTGRALACRPYATTGGPGMKETLSTPMARDTTHQQQWLAGTKEFGGIETRLPLPDTFPQEKEHSRLPPGTARVL